MSDTDMVAGRTDVVAGQRTMPDSMARAVRLMTAGAASEVVSGAVVALGGIHKPSVVISGIVTSVIVAGIWIAVARLCRRGRPMGRVLASVLFVFNTGGLVQTLAGEFHVQTAVVIVNIVGWIVGLAAVILLWNRDSTEFLQPGR